MDGVGLRTRCPLQIAANDITGKYSTSAILQQYGFSQTTQYTPSNDNFLTPATTLSDPFPAGIKRPAGSSQRLGTFAGQTIQLIAPDAKDPLCAALEPADRSEGGFLTPTKGFYGNLYEKLIWLSKCRN